MPKNPPHLSEADIRQLSSEQSFSRGKNYYRNGTLFELIRQGNEIRAYCEGSSYEPYRVSATLGGQGVETTFCTCPYDWGGLCKHLVALLLAWVHEPDSFHAIPPLDELLAGRSKDELIGLIKEMLKRQPDLVRLLELPVQPDRQTPLDLEAFRRQISYALRQHDRYDYPNAAATATELAALVETADRFGEAEDWLKAGAIYALILKEVIPHYAELYDEDGDVALVLQGCAEGLGLCLTEGAPAVESRRMWLEALLEAELKDVEMGGLDLAFPAGDIVVEQATDEEWRWIEARVQEAITAQTGHYSDWPREALVRFLARRLAVKGNNRQVDELIMAQGSPQQKAFLLVERSRFDEAIAIAQQHFGELPGLVIQFADALVKAGANEAATAFVVSLLDSRSRSTCLSWLAQHAEKSGDLSGAIEWWRQSLEQSPSLQTYQTMRELAQRLGVWPETRQELLSALETRKLGPILLEIALDEGDVARALELLPQLRVGWYGSNYELRVAQAAEAEYPQAALEIYRRRAEQLIAGRGRENYRSAAELLSRAREIYRHQNAESTWQHYISELRQNNRQLPALQDELKKARL